ncbi:MAG: pentapeptide repeat-containing protein [Deltaproteobacteria bacterium]|jgi:serine/threonine-protein kinase|nr:pentapeptide repeat-containing protein [Deltaproteobacteria bacterium]MBW2530382.1 pentapeptide repeat-containing protein [Deltaproteobacteria bacterium]
MDSVDLPLVAGAGAPAAGDRIHDEPTYDEPTNMWDRDRLVSPDQQAALDGKLEPGATLGAVRLVEVIASGDRVSSWRAQRRDGTQVTVHTLYEDASRRERETFHEAASRQDGLARQHPFRGIASVSKIYEGRGAYVVDVAAAGTMDDLPMLSWALPEKLAFFRKMAAALGAAHSSGVIHGCLRPAGVLLDDEELAAVLSDVGTIKLNDSYDVKALDTAEYAPFAAPEVLKGNVPDVRSDVYSLGRCLYFLLLGEHPSDPDEEIPHLEALTDEPEGLVRIVRKCTVLDPTKRYARVDQLLDDLAKYQNHKLVGMDAPSEPDTVDREGTPPPRPAERAAPRAKPKEQKKEAPPPVVAPRLAPTTKPDVDEPIARAILILWIAGAVIIGLTLGAAYLLGRPSLALSAGVLLGALLLSLVVPALGERPMIGRVLFAAVFILTAVWLDPSTAVALAGRRGQLTRGDPLERAQTLAEMKSRGVVDFAGIDFRHVDLSGRDLAFLIFDGADFRDAKLVGSRLEGCSFVDADLSRADLSGANLNGVITTGILGWNQVRCDDETRLPEGWSCVGGLPRADAMGGLPEEDEEDEGEQRAPGENRVLPNQVTDAPAEPAPGRPVPVEPDDEPAEGEDEQ